jgi:hypothetical protein
MTPEKLDESALNARLEVDIVGDPEMAQRLLKFLSEAFGWERDSVKTREALTAFHPGILPASLWNINRHHRP